MTSIPECTKIEFYKFINGDLSIPDIENYILSHPDLEQKLSHQIYLELITFDFNDKNARDRLRQFLFQHILEEGQFETWKIKSILSSFLTDIDNIQTYLEKLYDLSCGIYQETGPRKYSYRFLNHLAFHHFHLIDELERKSNEVEGSKISFPELEFYHRQLVPFATEIIKALDENKIQILNDGTYLITEEQKARLESEKSYKLIHPDQNDADGTK